MCVNNQVEEALEAQNSGLKGQLAEALRDNSDLRMRIIELGRPKPPLSKEEALDVIRNMCQAYGFSGGDVLMAVNLEI